MVGYLALLYMAISPFLLDPIIDAKTHHHPLDFANGAYYFEMALNHNHQSQDNSWV